jgi:hypothetical protein
MRVMRRKISAVGFFLGMFFLESCQNKSNLELRLIQDRYSFGEVKKGDTLYHDFIVLNESRDTLNILNAKGSCECTTVDWTSTPLTKGDTGLIKIQYVPEKVGFSNKTIVIETNAEVPFTVLSIEANVIE